VLGFEKPYITRLCLVHVDRALAPYPALLIGTSTIFEVTEKNVWERNFPGGFFVM
jgi:hypothetical protein